MAPKTGYIWEDKEVKFDLPFTHLRLRTGELILERLDSVEDTKGNSGMKGRLLVTNLRLMWHSVSSPRINMSIGLNSVISACPRTVTSGLRGVTQALCMLAVFHNNRYEFIFTNLVHKSTRHFTSVIGIHKSYISSKLYRELKLRGAIVRNKQLNILPLEQICLNEHSVWNLSSDAGNLGTLIVTNVRVVWFADINESFNISLPYISIESIKIRESKFGEALVISSVSSRASKSTSTGYVLGFRVDPASRLADLHKELVTLHSIYTAKPIFGVSYKHKCELSPTHSNDVEELSGLQEIGEPRGEMGPQLYLASQAARTLTLNRTVAEHTDDTPASSATTPVFDAYLGLAVEPLQEGFTLKSLWEVQPSA